MKRYDCPWDGTKCNRIELKKNGYFVQLCGTKEKPCPRRKNAERKDEGER